MLLDHQAVLNVSGYLTLYYFKLRRAQLFGKLVWVLDDAVVVVTVRRWLYFNLRASSPAHG